MTPDEVAAKAKCCTNKGCGIPMWLIHQVKTGKAMAWYCERCNDWCEPGHASDVSKREWDAYVDLAFSTESIKHGEGLRPGVAEINRK